MLLIVALVVSASASGLHEAGGARRTDSEIVSVAAPGSGSACADAAAAGCDAAAAASAARVVLSAATFAPGSAELPDPLARTLKTIGGALRADRAVVRVEVHTDASTSDEGNRALSQRRADAIRQLLIDLGVEPYRVQAVGMGASRPIFPRDPLAPGNRRIEIIRL